MSHIKREVLIHLALDDGSFGRYSRVEWPDHYRWQLDTKVACVDADMCAVHIENGDSLSADLLVGADGIHSRFRQSLPELKTIAPTRADNYCYRVLLPRAKMMSHPLTAMLMQNPNQLCWTDV